MREIGELHLQAGRSYKLTVTSEDIIHSLVIPGLRINVDALPGKQTVICITPSKAGRFPFACGEYCGTNHRLHVGTLVVLDKADFEKWVANLGKNGLAEKVDSTAAHKGRELFLKLQCAICHSGDEKARGPNLEGLFGKKVPVAGGAMADVDEKYLRESIREPRAKRHDGWEPIMPPFNKEQLKDEDLDVLVAFLKGLKPGGLPKRFEVVPPSVGK